MLVLNTALIQSVGAQAPTVVLMFSGGRDSSLAALRLAAAGVRLVLVTISASHLVGVDSVRARVRELAAHLPLTTPWIRISQPQDIGADTSFYERTCLPCHHAYIVASAAVCRALGLHHVALGYVSYQGGWPEQTLPAITRLRSVLGRYGLTLLLPVYDVSAQGQAEVELTNSGLSPTSLEQKCLLQVSNIVLSSGRLDQQLELWEHAINHSMASISELQLDVLEVASLANA